MKIVQLIQTLKDVNKNRNFQIGNLMNIFSCFKKRKQHKNRNTKSSGYIYVKPHTALPQPLR